MKRVLLTGASGFIGQHAIAPLIARGYDIHAVSSSPRETASPSMRCHRTNLLDAAALAHLVQQIQPTHLLHFAWYAEPGGFWRSSENFRWLEASIGLLRYFREHGGQRVVMAGTCAEYDWDFGFCSETITPCQPATAYGVCKNALQETLKAYSAEHRLSSAWGRIFFLYGPGEHPARLVPSVIASLLRGEAARCTHGDQIRDFLHVKDVADAFVALLDSPVEGAVNIASGNPVALRQIVLAAADCLAARERVQFGAPSPPDNEPPLLVADCRRLTNELGWRPKLDLATGMAQTVQHWQQRFER